ncbi:MAG: hypothetical protein AB7S44_04225 [Spirochaetales bacterium]
MKKQLKIIVLILSFICLSSFTGCTLFTQPEGYFFRLRVDERLVNLPDELIYNELTEPIMSNKIFISSNSEIDDLFSETYSESYSEEEQSWVRDERFTNLINGYDEGFFENNQIVCLFITAGGSAYSYKLKNTDYNSGVLTITIKERAVGIGTCEMEYRLAIIEIEKVPTDTVVKIEYKDNWLQNLFW